MRRLGDDLGFEAMSLYRHVANKDDLLDGMLDLVLAEWQQPDADADWIEAIRPSAIPFTTPSAATAGRRAAHDRESPATRPAALHERASREAQRAGFDAETTYHVYHLLDGFIFGFSFWEIAYTTIPLDDEAVTNLMQSIPWDDYPNLTEHRDQHLTEGPHRDVKAFEVGLDLLLDGLAERLRTR